MNQDWRQARVLFRFNGVPVKVRPSFWPMWLSGWPVLIWLARRRRPERTWMESVLMGTAAMPLTLTADLGHALAHTVSARACGAPMDEIRLAEDMPRTIYFDNDVSPDAHRIRALGGPIFSGLGLLLSLLWRRFSKRGSAGRELAELSMASHGMILGGSLMPVGMVDGGTLLRWTLIDKGMSGVEADRQVWRAGIVVGIFLGVTAVVGLLVRWLRNGWKRGK